MTHLTRSRRPIVAALVLTAVLSIAPLTFSRIPVANAYQRVPQKICSIDWHQGPVYVRRLIRCAARHWHVPGGPQKALFIAWRESRFVPTANNPSGAEGIYQHMRQYWPKRAFVFGFRSSSAFNARANIIVTMRMVHAMGNWSPWGA